MTIQGSRPSRVGLALNLSFWSVAIAATILLWVHDQSSASSPLTPSGDQDNRSAVLGSSAFMPPFALGPDASPTLATDAQNCANVSADNACTLTASEGSDPSIAATATPWIEGYNNCGDITGEGYVDQSDLDLEGNALASDTRLVQYDVSRDGVVNYWDKLVIWVQLGSSCSRTDGAGSATGNPAPLATATPSIPATTIAAMSTVRATSIKPTSTTERAPSRPARARHNTK